MLSFPVKSTSPNFPSHIEGVVLPDIGDENINFGEESILFRYRDAPVIALFIREFNAGRSLHDLLYFHRQGRLGAIATFGLFQNTADHTEGTSHFEIISRQVGMPFIYLDRGDTASMSLKDWVWNNPLQDTYRKHVSLDYAGTTASFALVD